MFRSSFKIFHCFSFLLFIKIFCLSCNPSSSNEWDNFYIDLENNNVLSFINQLNESKNLSHHDQVKLALLPVLSITNNLESKVSSKIVQRYISAKKANWNLEYAQAVTLLDSILNNYTFTKYSDTILYKEVLDLKFQIFNLDEKNIDFEDKLFSILKNTEFNQLSILNKYWYLKTLYNKAKYTLAQSKIDEGLVTLEYAIHLMHSNDLISSFNSLYYNLIITKANRMLKEEQTKNAIHLYNTILDEADFNSKLIPFSKVKIELANCYLLSGKNNLFLQLMNEVRNDKHENSPFIDWYWNLNFGYFHNDNGQNELSLSYYRNALDKFNHIECSKFKSVTCLNIAETYLEINKPDSANYFLSLANNLEACEPYEKKIIKFYSLKTKVRILNKLFADSNSPSLLDSILTTKLEIRQMSNEIWTDEKALHLDDFYVQNCASVISFIESNYKQNIPESLQYLIIELLHDTKSRELKKIEIIKKTDHSNNHEDSLQYALNSMYRIIDDHKINDDYANQVYKELYTTFQSKLNLDKTRIKIKEDYKINLEHTLTEIKKKINKGQSQVLEFLYYGNQYWYYSLSPSRFKLGKLDAKKLDSLIKIALKEVFNHHPIVAGEIIVSNYFSKIIDSNFNNLNILTDGLLNNYPFDISLDLNLKTTKQYSISEILSHNATVINDDISILSYSSPQTISDKRSKKMILDLPGGYQECLEINELFDNSELISGQSLQSRSFENSMSSTLLHFSTHAFSDTINRWENYIYIRNVNNQPLKIYSTDIASFTSTPKFVNLSACETGKGIHVSGEGSYTLSRAFLSNGTETVIKTLWKVDDTATKEFMIQFYKIWKSGHSVSDALFQTKSTFQRTSDYSHPYYWAGFVLEGNPNLFLTN